VSVTQRQEEALIHNCGNIPSWIVQCSLNARTITPKSSTNSNNGRGQHKYVAAIMYQQTSAFLHNK
jgi:hypothetical protein